VLPVLQSQIRAGLPGVPLYRSASLADLVADTLVGRRFMATFIVAFSVLAVALAADACVRRREHPVEPTRHRPPLSGRTSKVLQPRTRALYWARHEHRGRDASGGLS
jgi:hypothetical protein